MKDALYDWFGLNVWLFKLINGFSGNAAYDHFMLFITQFGDKMNFKYYFIVVLLILLGEAAWKKAHGETITRQNVNEAAALLITLVMAFVACGLAVRVLKEMFALPRPFMLTDLRPHMHFLAAYPGEAEYNTSLPSGHAATISFIVTALWYAFNNRTVHYCGIALGVAVCWSRIAVGMHFPVDVLVGAGIGFGITYYVRRYVYRMMKVQLPAPAK